MRGIEIGSDGKESYGLASFASFEENLIFCW